MYDTTDELLREILAGEDSFIDFKEIVFKGNQIRFAGEGVKVTTELAKDLTCFANTEGGVIVFGVRDDRERIGIPEERFDELQQMIVNVAQNNVEPGIGHLLLFDRVLLPDSSGVRRLCLKLEIKKAQFSVHAPKGRRPYRRTADHCHEMTLEEQARAFERKGMMKPFEERPVYSAGTDDLAIGRFSSYYEARYAAPLDVIGPDLERLLLNLKITDRDESGALHPTALGLLLFTPSPDVWLSGSFIDTCAYEGSHPDSDRQRDAKVIRGSVVDQIEKVTDYFSESPFLPVAASKDGRGRIDKPSYSLRALQEAVVNAIVHRDYSIHGAQIRIFIFADRIEISNPGRLHNTLSPDDLFAGCQPVRRNQMLAGFLRDYTSPLTQRSYMEGRGEGFLAMVRECIKISGREPDLEIIGDSVKLTVWSR
jgi:predicted HTH transcriptional regulator